MTTPLPWETSRPVLLLVHGAWLGAWSWERVQPELTARGWEVQTVDLPSVADVGGPRFGLHDDAAVVRERIEEIGRPVVVVAHSYGGAVVTQGAAGLANVRHIVYVCAFQLDVGESLIELSGRLWWWNVEGDTMTTRSTREILFTNVLQEDSDRAVDRMRPFSYVAVTESLTAAAWHTVPSTYIVCEQDRAVAEQEVIAARATHQRRLPADHMPLLSMPLALTDLIVEAASRPSCHVNRSPDEPTSPVSTGWTHVAPDDPGVERLAHSTLADEYDFIVCGSGSAGSVVAGRIAENPGVSVLLIEAGTHDATSSVMVPALWPTNLGTERDWAFRSEANPHINNRTLPLSMGKVLGGGSSINVMAWSRGHRSDWDFYASQADDTGWSYKAVVDIYRRIEHWHGARDPRYRGSAGPVGIQPASSPNRLGAMTLEAARALGLPTFEHPNGKMMESDGGAAIADVIVVGGQRQSMFRSYVYPMLDRPNLTVVTQALVTRLSVANNRVTGVEVRRDGRQQHVAARGEVVLSLGAINSPKVLMQSGIGDASQLREFSIGVRQHLPGVGKNLQDHPCVPVNFEFPEGLTATNLGETQLFWASDPILGAPDLFCCQAETPFASAENLARYGELPPACWTFAGSLTHPRSRGSVRLGGSAPDDPVRVDLNSLSDPDDLDLAVSCVEFLRELGNSRALRPFVKREVMPGNLKGDELRTFVRNAVIPYWHYSGTAKLGDDALSVVGSDLRVHGMENLRVADASVLPRITSGNTMAPCVVIGERAAECIREQHSL